MTARARRPPAETASASGRRPPIEILLVAILAACACGDVLRLGFFADDFHFLDAARRQPPLEVLLGQHGIWPWFRPLSRELYFYVAAWAGRQGANVAHLLSLLGLIAAAWALLRIGERLLGRVAAVAAVALFVTCSLTKLLVGWASGFQDLLAVALVLWALLEHMRGRRARALPFAGLAPFAKEPGFLVFPLILLEAWICERARRWEPWMTRLVLVALGAAAIHAGARLTWPSLARPVAEVARGATLVPVLGEIARSFVTIGAPASGWGWAAGWAAGIAAAILLTRIPKSEERAIETPPRAARIFLALALALGLVPFVASALSTVSVPRPHFVFAALPWAFLLLASATPAGIARFVVPPLVAINVWGLGYHAPNLDAREGWELGPLGWIESTRVDARTRRLAEDLRGHLAGRAESTVVIFEVVPSGSMIQSEDGPAAREILGDRTVRTWFIREAPRDLPRERLVILSYDPVEAHRFVKVPRDCGASMRRALNALFEERPRVAGVWASYCADAEAGAYPGYLRAAAALLESGAEDYAGALEREGLLDSTGAAPALATPWMVGADVLAPTYAPALRTPRSADAHFACAARLSASGFDLLAAAELRIGLALRGGTSREYLELGRLLAAHGHPAEARPELERAVQVGAPADAAAEAAAMLASLKLAGP